MTLINAIVFFLVFQTSFMISIMVAILIDTYRVRKKKAYDKLVVDVAGKVKEQA